MVILLPLAIIATAVLVTLRLAATSGPSDNTPSSRPTVLDRPLGPAASRLYVLDPAISVGSSKILSVDPSTLEDPVKRRMSAGESPLMAVSPDGSHIYVASKDGGDPERDELATIETSSGSVIDRDTIRHLAHDTLVTSSPDMAISRDGRWVYIYQLFYADGVSTGGVATFDTLAGDVLPESVRLGECGDPALLPLEADRRLAVACTSTNEVHFLDISPSGAASTSEVLQVPVAPDDPADPNGPVWDLGLSWAVQSPDSRLIYAVTHDGRVFVIDAISQTVERTVDLRIPLDRRISAGQVLLSPTGEELYVGLADSSQLDVNSADQIRTISTLDWSILGIMDASRKFLSFNVGSDPKTLYGVDPETRTLLVFDLDRQRETGAIRVGSSPMLVHAAWLGQLEGVAASTE